MKQRTFGIALSALMLAPFYATAAANFLLDPEGIFAINPAPQNANQRFSSLMNYLSDPLTYDALLFGSSRAQTIPLDLLSRRLGGVRVASFAVADGLMPDFLPAMEYVTKSRAGSGRPLHKVFLVLDVDRFGQPGFSTAPQVWLPPQYTGESPWRFRWR